MNPRKGFRPSSMQGDANRLIKLFHADAWRELENEARKFVRKFPDLALGYKALVASLIQQRRETDALVVADTAIAKFPKDPELLNNRSAALLKNNRYEDAITSANAALDLDPRNASAYSNRGIAYRSLGMWQDALASYSRAIELAPNDAISLNNAGVALIEMEHYEQAIVCLEAAINIKQDYDEAFWNLGRANEELKRFKDAASEFTKVLARDSSNAFARSRLAHIYRTECRFDDAALHTEALLQQIRSGTHLGNISPFPILSLEGSTTTDQRIAGHASAAVVMEPFISMPPIVNKFETSGNRRLRIGYLSSDFFHHATLMLLIGVLEHHDLMSLDIYLYSHGSDDDSDLRHRAEKACTAFRNIRPLSYLDAARAIAGDGIDILVDLKGYTKDARLQICALRPAPIIVSWLGYPGTLGHPRLADYIIGDPIVTPLEHQADYSETLALLPHCYQPNDSARKIGETPSRESLGLPKEAIVFCSFNQTYKITADVLAQWCRLLDAVPNSVLWLMVSKEEIQRNLIEFVKARGVAASRLIFASMAPIEQHLARLQQADIALDTSPYSSHTTGSDALWAGVPLIAIQGLTFASRVSSSLLTNVGLPELIADTPSKACDLAIKLANDPSRLRDLKQKLLAARTNSPLFDTSGFTRDLERLYQSMWEYHACGDRSPIVVRSI